MSGKYSTSPALHLPIAESRSLRHLQNLLLAALALASLETALRGYHWLALILLLALIPSRAGMRRQASAGTCISWRAGQWAVSGPHGSGTITLLRWHRLPWVTYIAWSGPGRRRARAWLFVDSAPRQQLRRLRVRLALQRGP